MQEFKLPVEAPANARLIAEFCYVTSLQSTPKTVGFGALIRNKKAT